MRSYSVAREMPSWRAVASLLPLLAARVAVMALRSSSATCWARGRSRSVSAGLLWAGDGAGAVSVLTAALQDAEQSVGPLDELTVTIRSNLAHGHAALGRADLAHAQLERAATDCPTLLGANHPDTVALRTDLALLVREGVGPVTPAEA